MGELTYEIVVVDAGSTDDTASAASEAGAGKVLRLGTRSRDWGFGSCVRHAFNLMEGQVMFLVSDVEIFDPAEAPRLVRLLLAGEADVVFSPYGVGRKRILKDPTKVFEEAVRHKIDDQYIEALIPHYYPKSRLRKFLEPSPKLPRGLNNRKTQSLAKVDCLLAGRTVLEKIPVNLQRDIHVSVCTSPGTS